LLNLLPGSRPLLQTEPDRKKAFDAVRCTGNCANWLGSAAERTALATPP
jgi:hypothetical protein